MAVVEPIMDHLMAASTAIDHARHVRDFSRRLLTQLSVERFEAIRREYQATRGCLARRELIAILRRPDSIAVLWRQAFTKVEGAFVAGLVLVERDARYLVDHVMVF